MQTTSLGHILADTVSLLLMVVFGVTGAFPAQALAFAELVALPRQPLIFVRDPSLADTASPGGHAGVAASQIPWAAHSFAPGMAVRVLATAYSSAVGETDSNPFVTASGRPVRSGTLAANFLPFGTQVRIGDTLYVVEDRMSSRYDNRYIIDVWMPSHAAATQFGVRVVEIEIVALP